MRPGQLAIAQSACRPVVILVEKGTRLPFDVKDFRTLTYDLRIPSFTRRTHFNPLINMLEELKQLGWRADDVFRAHRRASDVQSYVDVKSYGIALDKPDGTDRVDVVDLEGRFQFIPPGYASVLLTERHIYSVWSSCNRSNGKDLAPNVVRYWRPIWRGTRH